MISGTAWESNPTPLAAVRQAVAQMRMARWDTPGQKGSSQMQTVLIADDEAGLRLLVAPTIRSDLCEVLEAADGDQARALLQRHPPAVAIWDLHMPGRSGLELARATGHDPHSRGQLCPASL